MERQNAEKGWNQLRYDARVYTIQNERNRRVGAPGGDSGSVQIHRGQMLP